MRTAGWRHTAEGAAHGGAPCNCDSTCDAACCGGPCPRAAAGSTTAEGSHLDLPLAPLLQGSLQRRPPVPASIGPSKLAHRKVCAGERDRRREQNEPQQLRSPAGSRRPCSHSQAGPQAATKRTLAASPPGSRAAAAGPSAAAAPARTAATAGGHRGGAGRAGQRRGSGQCQRCMVLRCSSVSCAAAHVLALGHHSMDEQALQAAPQRTCTIAGSSATVSFTTKACSSPGSSGACGRGGRGSGGCKRRWLQLRGQI